MHRRTLLYASLAVLLPSPFGAPAAAQGRTPLTVFAAASLTEARQAAGKAYTARTGVPVRFSFASSSVLARQIEAGARADIFVSADVQWMDHAAKAGTIDLPSRRNLLRGRLVLVAPADSGVALRIAPRFALAQALGSDGRLALGDPDYVPAGLYAKAALTKLGVVYETDARAEPGVRVVDVFPEGTHPPIDYPLATVRGAAVGAKRFAAWLGSGEAKAIFHRYGFRTYR